MITMARQGMNTSKITAISFSIIAIGTRLLTLTWIMLISTVH